MRHPHSPARKDICLAHSFIAFNGASYDLTETIKAKLSLNQELLVHSVDKTVAFAYRPRQEPAATLGHLRESDDLLTLVLGDESEPDASPACQPSGYAAMVEINLVTKHIRVISVWWVYRRYLSITTHRDHGLSSHRAGCFFDRLNNAICSLTPTP